MMKQILDNILDKAGDESAQVQILMSGNLFAGAMKRTEDGGYVLLTVGSVQNRQILIDVHINPDAVDAVMIPSAEQAPAVSSRPNGGGLIIPGMS
jgi:hypothetical protein